MQNSVHRKNTLWQTLINDIDDDNGNGSMQRGTKEVATRENLTQQCNAKERNVNSLEAKMK